MEGEVERSTKKCPQCKNEVTIKRWSNCSRCGADVHFKIKPTGRIKRIIWHFKVGQTKKKE